MHSHSASLPCQGEEAGMARTERLRLPSNRSELLKVVARSAVTRLSCAVGLQANELIPEDFTGVHDVLGIKCMLQHTHCLNCIFAMFLHQEIRLVQSHAVLAGAGAIH